MDYDTAVKISDIEKSLEKMQQRLAEMNKEVSWIDSRIKKEDKKYSEIVGSAVSPLESALENLRSKTYELEKSMAAAKREIKPHSHEEVAALDSQVRQLKKISSAVKELKEKINYVESVAYEAAAPKFDSKAFEKKISNLSAELKALSVQVSFASEESAQNKDFSKNEIIKLESELRKLSQNFSSLEGSILAVRNLNDSGVSKLSNQLSSSIEILKSEISTLKSQVALAYSKAEKSSGNSESIKILEAKLAEANKKLSRAASDLKSLSDSKIFFERKLLELSEIPKAIERLAGAEELEELRQSVEEISEKIKSNASLADVQPLKQIIFSAQQSIDKIKSESSGFATLPQLRSLESQIAAFSKFLKEIDNLKAESKSQNISLSEVEKRLSENLLDLEDSIDSLKKDFENKLESVSEEYRKSGEQASLSKEKSEELRQALDANILELGEKIKFLQEELSNAKLIEGRLKAEINAPIENISLQIESMKGEHAEKFSELANEKENIESKISALHDETNIIREKQANSENNVESLKEKFENDLASVSSQLNKLESLNSSMAELEEKIEAKASAADFEILSEKNDEILKQTEDEISEIKSKLFDVEKSFSSAASMESLENIESNLKSKILEGENSIEGLRKSLDLIKEDFSGLAEIEPRAKQSIEAIKSEVSGHIGKLAGKIEENRESILAELSSELSDLATKAGVSESLAQLDEKISAAGKSAIEIEKQLKGEAFMKFSVLSEELKKVHGEVKKFENLDARLLMMENSGIKNEIKNLKAEISNLKALSENLPKDVKADSIIFRHKIKSVEDELHGFAENFSEQSEKKASDFEAKISEVSRATESAGKVLNKVLEAEEKLMRLENQNMLIAKTLSENMNVLRDWSRSVESRLAQTFDLQTHLIRELEGRRGFQKSEEKI